MKLKNTIQSVENIETLKLKKAKHFQLLPENYVSFIKIQKISQYNFLNLKLYLEFKFSNLFLIEFLEKVVTLLMHYIKP